MWGFCFSQQPFLGCEVTFACLLICQGASGRCLGLHTVPRSGGPWQGRFLKTSCQLLWVSSDYPEHIQYLPASRLAVCVQGQWEGEGYNLNSNSGRTCFLRLEKGSHPPLLTGVPVQRFYFSFETKTNHSLWPGHEIQNCPFWKPFLFFSFFFF